MLLEQETFSFLQCNVCVTSKFIFLFSSLSGVASVASTTVANNSKEMSAISDFPPPKELPNYCSHKKLYELIEFYCKTYDILPHMKFNHEVVRIRPAEDYDATGRWVVVVKNHNTGKLSSDIYDGVFVCTGQFSYPNMPQFPGQEKFKGRIMHSKHLKTFESFKGQRVVVLGIGCSGCDAATETSNFAEQVRK